MKNKRIYLDYASTTPLDRRVEKEIEKHFSLTFGNPAGLYAEGVSAKKVLEDARTDFARQLEVHSDEVIFTGSGTEANNLAILGAVAAGKAASMKFSEMHAVTTAIEHSSVLECFKVLEKMGVAVSYLPVQENGIVSLGTVRNALRPNTVLISVMLANNEIGTIQPVSKIGKIIRDFRNRRPAERGKIIFHTDASQAGLFMDIKPEHLGVDLMTVDGHKVYGPKGVGALFVKRGLAVAPIQFGGGQERTLRPGTENVPLIAGMVKAFQIAAAEREKEAARLLKLRHYLHSGLIKSLGTVAVNGDLKERLPNNLNISLPGIDTEFLVIRLDARGISCSTKSACDKDERRSYVVAALPWGGEERSGSTLRISLGRFTQKSDIDRFLKILGLLLKNYP
jgi:cysteine desulfurase